MFSRELRAILASERRSVLLLGPRQTGKTTLLRSLAPDIEINLAKESTFLDFQADPEALENVVRAKKPKTVFIDEVQRVPSLLNTVQAILDQPSHPRFFLSGSSARKLKRGQANLLPGRILVRHLGPLSFLETDGAVSVTDALAYGTLPGIVTAESGEKKELLRSYSGTYLKEEIQAESLARDLPGFSRFLRTVASRFGEFIDFSKYSSEAQIKRHSCARYFDILEDTLIIERIDPFSSSGRKRLVQHPRFYFFDNGVLNGLLGEFGVSGDRIGRLFENLVYSQLRATAFALKREIRLSTYRTDHGAEIDFILEDLDEGRIFAIEAKASRNVSASDMRGFESFKDVCRRKFIPIVVTLGGLEREVRGVRVAPIEVALRSIFS